jgi:zinc transport system ATP-binding protein
MPTESPILELNDLSIRRGEHRVVDGVSMAVERGQFAGLIGPNGAGKSSVLQAIVGLVRPESGRIDCRARRIGYVPQSVAFDRELPLTVHEFLSLRLAGRGLWTDRRLRASREAALAQLEEIGAEHLIDRRLGRLSGGEFQRVLIAYALLDGPDLLLLDEPLTGVDVRGGLSFDGLLHHLHEDRGITIVMVSHDLHLIEHQSDVVFCLNTHLCCSGVPEEVLKPENLSHAYGHLPRLRPGSAKIPPHPPHHHPHSHA